MPLGRPSARQVSAASSDEALTLVLTELRDHGSETRASDPVTELLNFGLTLTDPRRRLLANPGAGFRLIDAVARFTWMMAGNDRLEDIAFYQPKVRDYSDDGLIVPGSDYGKRLFAPQAGLDQIDGVVSRLRDQLESGEEGRRAAAVIWQPDDAVRESTDIPCAFGLFFNVRRDQLLTTVMMRSNNAATLLQMNLFEFGLLAEVIAAELRIELGPLYHFAGSMHFFQRHGDRVSRALDWDGPVQHAMPPVPTTPSPLSQCRELGRLEAKMRIELASLNGETVEQILARGEALNVYWRAFLRVLLIHALMQLERFEVARAVCAELPSQLSALAAEGLEKAGPREGSSSAVIRPDELVGPGENDAAMAALESICEEIGRGISAREFESLREHFIEEPVAARSEDPIAFDRMDVERYLDELRQGRLGG